MASWIWGSNTNPQIEELIEKACSPLNLPWPESEDIALNLEICDMIRSKTIPPRAAMQSLKSRIASKNGRVQMSALGLTDTCIKNGGDHFLQELAGKEFVGEMMGIIRAPATNPQVRKMALELFQQWAISFETKISLSYLPEMYRELKASGVSFPPAPTTVASHLLTTATPPSWIDSDSCMRCRSAFTFTNRKHHCRNCGLVFDQACSSKAMKLPDLGILQEVRVCEPCYAKAGKGRLSKNDPSTPAVPAKRSVRADQFDADLQRAISLSLTEGSHITSVTGSQPVINGRQLEGTDDIPHEDEDFRLAIEASLAETNQVQPSAPGGSDETEIKPLPTYDLTTRETETLLTFAQTIDRAVGFGDSNLVKFPHARGLYDQTTILADKLHRNLDEKGTKYRILADMHNQLMQSVRTYDRLYSEQDLVQQQQYRAAQQNPYPVPLPKNLGYNHPDFTTPAQWSTQDVPLPPRFDSNRASDHHNALFPANKQFPLMPMTLPGFMPLHDDFSGRMHGSPANRPTVSAYPSDHFPPHLQPNTLRDRPQEVLDPALRFPSLPSAPTHDVSTLTHEMIASQTKNEPKEGLLIEL